MGILSSVLGMIKLYKVYIFLAILGVSVVGTAIATRTIVNNSWEASQVRAKKAHDVLVKTVIDNANDKLKEATTKNEQLDLELKQAIKKAESDTRGRVTADDLRSLH